MPSPPPNECICLQYPWNGKGDNRQTYPDYPRLNCFLGTCSIFFEGMNILTMNWEGWREYGQRVGILLIDFPGAGLINKVCCNILGSP